MKKTGARLPRAGHPSTIGAWAMRALVVEGFVSLGEYHMQQR
jgi:hypothetical protein